MHEARNQSDDDINCFLLSRATTGTNFDFIPYVGVEITGRERVRTVYGSRGYRERQGGDRMWESRLQGETGWGYTSASVSANYVCKKSSTYE